MLRKRHYLCALMISAIFASQSALAQTTAPQSDTYFPSTAPEENYVVYLQASNGNFYGIAQNEDGDSSIFSLQAPEDVYAVLGKTVTLSQNAVLCLEQPNGTLLGISNGSFFTANLNGTIALGAAIPDGGVACPVLASDGNYYGANESVIYKLTPEGVVSTVYTFPNGTQGPYSYGLLQGSTGNLYGVDSTGFFSYNFTSGYTSVVLSGLASTPIEGADGNYYVIATESSTSQIYKITPAGAYSVFWNPSTKLDQLFAGADKNIYALEESDYSGLPGAPCGGGGNYFSLVPVSLAGVAGSSFNIVGTNESGDETVDDYALQLYLAGNGNFYGSYNDDDVYYVGGGGCGSTTFNDVFGASLSATPTAPISMKLSADHVLPGKTTTLTWQVNNATSETQQQCYGYGGLSGKVALSGTLTSPALGAGVYSAAIVCGGTQTGFAQVTVGHTQVTLTTSGSSNRVVSGQPVTLYVEVANDGDPTPTGTVQFLVGTDVIGSTTLASPSYTASTTGVPLGTYNVVAKYLGDGNYAAATSAALPIQVVAK